MNGAFILVGTAVCFLIAYYIYGQYLRKLFGVNEQRITPACAKNDGVDYVPTKLPVLFGHHFASIAGAGPIVGPIAAVYFGWLPVLLWILIGCIFIGAVHDFAALFLSVRNDGKSIGYVIESQIGYFGRQIFLLFSWAALILVVAVFAIHVARTFVITPAVATASILFVIMAPCFGWLVYKKNVSILTASLIFVPLLFVSIFLGARYPCDLTLILGISPEWAERAWLCILFIYVFVASVIPVWVLLQPRDYLNSYLLYTMMVLGFAGVIVAAPSLKSSAFNGFSVIRGDSVSMMFPILFVTVACGACSGFHSLVSSGTTSKQIEKEKHILPIGYGSMLIEGVLAVMAMLSVAYLSADVVADVADKPVAAFASGMAKFCESIKIPHQAGNNFFTLAISAFLLTTLDTATRLTRFSWQEMFLPGINSVHRNMGKGIFLRFISNRFTATFIAVIGAGYLAFTGETSTIWPVFGASNQLLAALTLLVVTLVLIRRKSNFWITMIPMIFMMVVCMWALCSLFAVNIKAENTNLALVIATAFLIFMAVMLVVQALIIIIKDKS